MITMGRPQDIYYTPSATAPTTDNGLYNNTHQQNFDSLDGNSQSHVDWSHVVDKGNEDVAGRHQVEEADPDDGYATEVGTQHHTQQNRTELIPSIYNTVTYTYRTAQDEFMGQFDDIDEIAYSTADNLPPQVVSPKTNRIIPRTVLVHERPQQVYQVPLVVHRVLEALGGTLMPKKDLPPPRWPVDEVSPRRRQAPRTANITSIFHEDEVVSGCTNGRSNANIPKDNTNTYHFTHTYSDMTGEKDFLAGNGRRQGRNPPNQPNRGRQNPNPVNVRRNPNRAARAVPGRGPVPPQPQLVGPQPQPQPVGPQPQPQLVGPQPQLQPVGPQPQPIRVPSGGPGGPGPGGPGGPGPGGPGGLGPGGPGGPGPGPGRGGPGPYEEGDNQQVQAGEDNLLGLPPIHQIQAVGSNLHGKSTESTKSTKSITHQIRHSLLIRQYHQRWEPILLQGLITNPQTQE